MQEVDGSRDTAVCTQSITGKQLRRTTAVLLFDKIVNGADDDEKADVVVDVVKPKHESERIWKAPNATDDIVCAC